MLIIGGCGCFPNSLRPDREDCIVIETDIQDLYALIRGARFANSLQDAAESAKEGDYTAALRIVGDVREQYKKKHLRTLKKDPSQVESTAKQDEARRLVSKQEKYRAALAKFDELLATLQRRAAVQKPQPAATVRPPSGDSSAAPQIPAEFLQAYEGEESRDARFQLILRHFEVREVAADHTIRTDVCYFLRDKDCDYFIRIKVKAGSDDRLLLEDAVSGEHLALLSTTKLQKLGKRRRLVELDPKQPKPDAGDAVPQRQGHDAEPMEGPLDVNEPDHKARDEILDKGAFTQLMDAAQRSRLVPSADQIGYVRDREFRMGRYQKASRAIEGMFNKFIASATQRTQRIRREEMDIASGRVKMHPRDLQAKRARDVAETQLVERARNRFMRVLEGLRILMATHGPGD
jgi:hypothetical protein